MSVELAVSRSEIWEARRRRRFSFSAPRSDRCRSGWWDQRRTWKKWNGAGTF